MDKGELIVVCGRPASGKTVFLTTMIREELETNDFYALNSKVARIASGLGITNYGMNTVMKNLSGGQKVKVILAKLLLEKPDLLILDEPTNFLDTVHVDWLVKYLKEYKGNFLIVSHNQEFLNDVVNVILVPAYNKVFPKVEDKAEDFYYYRKGCKGIS